MVPPPLLRRIRLLALALAGVLAALAWSIVRPAATPTGAGSTAEPHPEQTIPFTDVAPWGANFFLEREANPWDREETVRLAAQAGIRYAKQHFLWAYLEPEPGRFDWDAYDAIVDLYRSNDIEVIARLDWPPDWVPKAEWVPEPFRAKHNAPPADVGDYAHFVRQVVRHFKGRVRFYQIWNEPNLLSEWGFEPSHPVDPAEYTALLEAAARAAREADPNVVILSAPLAINTERVALSGNMSDLDYLEGMYANGAGSWFDVLSANAFGMDAPPSDPPDRSVLNFRRVELQRAIMERNGDADKPVWLAEYGWNAAPPGASEMAWRRVSEVQQAAWTVGGVAYGEENWPWSGVFNVWFFRQWGGITNDRAVYYFRMVDVEWTPRRLYGAVQAATKPLAVAGPGFWAERSAPVRLPTDLGRRDLWSWVWADGASDGNALLARESGATLTFPFEGRTVLGRFETGPQAGAVLVSVDGRPVASDGGGTTASLKDTAKGWGWRTLSTGLGPGPHVLELTAGAAGGTVLIDGFRVLDEPPAGLGLPGLPAALGVAAIVLAVLLAADIRRAARRIDG
jgi:polysaccharide biosynthesis protein PslG